MNVEPDRRALHPAEAPNAAEVLLGAPASAAAAAAAVTEAGGGTGAMCSAATVGTKLTSECPTKQLGGEIDKAAPVAAADPAEEKAPLPPAQPPLRRGQQVVLRVEVATKGQARLITWSVFSINLVFVLMALALLGLRSKVSLTVGQLRPYHLFQLIMGSICLGSTLAILAWFAYSIQRSKREERTWSKRQRFFAGTAAVLLCLQTLHSAGFVAAFASILAQSNCRYPWKLLAALEFVQWICFSLIMFFLLSRLQDMTRWRGRGALNMDPDFMLLVDRPWSDKARSVKVLAAIWAVLAAACLAAMIIRMQRDSSEMNKSFSCDVSLDDWECGETGTQVASAVLQVVMVLVFVAYWIRLVKIALRDHQQLPYTHYRTTHIFVRVQARVVGTVLTAVLMSMVLLTLVPAVSSSSSCWATVDAQLGNLPVTMSLTVAAVVLGILYMPKAQALDSPLLQEFLQDFSWTQAAMPADVERRNERLALSEAGAAGKPDNQVGLADVMMYLPDMMSHGLATLAGVQDANSAAEQLRREPLFCMETAVRLFYWMRMAYRADSTAEDPFITINQGLQLFHLEHYETIWDDTTDTHCVLGWSATQVVLAFRGTSSIQNVMTDVKAWKVRLQPEQWRRGLLLKVHAGFYGAWVHAGFHQKVLARLQEIDDLDAGATPLRFWITGHSLGGALAALAALAIRRQHPASKLTVYTFGSPRVGNGVFTEEYDEAVPDTWSILNDRDPVPWIPKVGFKRVGKRVTVDLKGNLILRPTYFELSMTHRGTTVKHHMTASYALSMAAVFRAQFVPSKQLPHGAEGVEQLAAAVDLGTCLVLSNMEIDCLKDKQQLPESLEALAAKQAEMASRQRIGKAADGGGDGDDSARPGYCGSFCGSGCGCFGRHRSSSPDLFRGAAGSGGAPATAAAARAEAAGAVQHPEQQQSPPPPQQQQVLEAAPAGMSEPGTATEAETERPQQQQGQQQGQQQQPGGVEQVAADQQQAAAAAACAAGSSSQLALAAQHEEDSVRSARSMLAHPDRPADSSQVAALAAAEQDSPLDEPQGQQED